MLLSLFKVDVKFINMVRKYTVALKIKHTYIKWSVVVNGVVQLSSIQYLDSSNRHDKRWLSLTELKLIKLSRMDSFPDISSFKVEIIWKQIVKMGLWELIKNLITPNLVSLHWSHLQSWAGWHCYHPVSNSVAKPRHHAFAFLVLNLSVCKF